MLTFLRSSIAITKQSQLMSSIGQQLVCQPQFFSTKQNQFMIGSRSIGQQLVCRSHSQFFSTKQSQFMIGSRSVGQQLGCRSHYRFFSTESSDRHRILGEMENEMKRALSITSSPTPEQPASEGHKIIQGLIDRTREYLESIRDQDDAPTVLTPKKDIANILQREQLERLYVMLNVTLSGLLNDDSSQRDRQEQLLLASLPAFSNGLLTIEKWRPYYHLAVFYQENSKPTDSERRQKVIDYATKAIEVGSVALPDGYIHWSEAYALRAEAYTDRGEFKEAINDLSNLLVEKPRNTDAKLQRAHVYLLDGLYLDACKDCMEVIFEDSQLIQPLVLRAAAMFKLNRFGSCVEDLTAAMKRNETETLVAMVVYGKFWPPIKNKQNDDKAQKFFNTVLRTCQKQGYYDIHDIYEYLKNKQNVLDSLNKVYNNMILDLNLKAAQRGQ